MPDPMPYHGETTAAGFATAAQMPPDPDAPARPTAPGAVVATVPERPAPAFDAEAIHNQEEDLPRLRDLYSRAGDMEVVLARIVERDPAAVLSGPQADEFNDHLKGARAFLPRSVALREDIEESYEGRGAREAYRDLHVTLVPTLHNALLAAGVLTP